MAFGTASKANPNIEKFLNKNQYGRESLQSMGIGVPAQQAPAFSPMMGQGPNSPQAQDAYAQWQQLPKDQRKQSANPMASFNPANFRRGR